MCAYIHVHAYTCICTLMHAVKSWEGGENSVDGVSVSGEWKKREADAWDQELDKGKVYSTSFYNVFYIEPPCMCTLAV